MTAGWWPYLVVVAGFLPNEAFRLAAVFMSRRIDPNSEVFVWVRIMATTLLAAVVSRLIYAPAAAYAGVPLALRIASVAVGVGGFYLCRRSLVGGILVGEAFFVGLAWWLGTV